jgi:hypothetical protein
MGVAPNRIDILTSVEALEFGAAHGNAVATAYGGLPIRVLSRDDLLKNKRAVGRPQDLLDVENLEKA